MVLIVPPNHPLARSGRATLDEIVAFPLMMLEQYETMKARIAAEVARHGLTLGIELHRRFCIVMLRDARPTAVVRRFCRHLREEMAEDARPDTTEARRN